MKLFHIVVPVLLLCAAHQAKSNTLSCPDLGRAVQVGTCPTEDQLRYTFTGYCSDDARAYRGDTEVCTDFQAYRQLKNVALWESADGAFDAYVSCNLSADAVKTARLDSLSVSKQGKLTKLMCSYPAPGLTFIHRTRAECTVDASAPCPADAKSCKASCK